jgi:hypothetical protein
MMKQTFKKLLESAKQERVFSIPRRFSNEELKKFASLFEGKVINISGWTDEDKQGARYQDYFTKCSEYVISNFDADKKGFQGTENEFFLDLEKDLLPELRGSFDVCFNHTTLEHVYDFRKAFQNICTLSKDVVIVVVPYLQQLHGVGYEDYWRFTPYAMKKMYEENGLKLRYCAANGKDRASIYLFCLGYRNNAWDEKIPERFDLKIDERKDLYADEYRNVIGGRVIE